MMLESLPSTHPDRSMTSLRKLLQVWKQIMSEELRGFPWKKGRQVIDRHNRNLGTSLGWHRHSWLIKICSCVVHRNWIVWVGGIGRNINNSSKISVFIVKHVHGNKWRDWLVQVDAVNKHICLLYTSPSPRD